MWHRSSTNAQQNVGGRVAQDSLRSARGEISVFRCVVFLLWLLVFATGIASASITRDVTVSQDGGTASATIICPAFTISVGNEELLALVATDYLSGVNTTVKSVTGGGLTWTLVKRTNAQSGSAEIWGAFSASPLTGVAVTATLSQSVVASITVMSFAGVNPAGAIGATGSKSAATGAPTASLITTASNSLVLGVGNDYSNAVDRTVGTGQTLLHQYLTPTGDTYWVQMQANAIALSGTTVTINDTAPTKDVYNLSIVELLAALSGSTTYSISGTISPTAGGGGATVTLGGASSATTVADANGNYSFTGLANGSYTVTPAKTGYTFAPASQPVTVNGANQTGVNFTAQAVASWSISGTISPTAGGGGATVTLSGTSSASTVADANGNYSFTGLANGSYSITPSKTGYTFTPASKPVTVSGANQTGVNFTAQAVASWSISGTISPTAGGGGATVTLSGASSASTVADANGNYSFTSLANGSYTVTPSKTGYTFTPASKPVTVSGANQTGVNFTAQAVASWSISGAISPTAGGAGATVVLSGASSASTVADANGNYSFTALANGSYAVTPTKTGYSFTPGSQSITLNGASQTGVNFTAQSTTQTYSISGAITPSAGSSGTTVALSGASSGSTTVDANGNYTFTQLANGTYTITPSKNGLAFTPANQSVIVNGANVGNVNFTAVMSTASIARDVTVSQDGESASATIVSPAFTTSVANEELLAFVATDYLSGANTTVKSVTGGGLTWTLVKRTNAQSGSADIWGAFSASPLTAVAVTATLSQSVVASITVMSFAGVNPAGAIGATGSKSAATGAPTASLITTASNSLVLGVGNDFSNAVSRTVGTGQTLLHQYLTPTGDTYWVQMQATAIPLSGTTVTINDTAPTKDVYNLSIVELLAGSGGSTATPPTVSMTSPAQGATVASLSTVSANASDLISVTGVQFLLDGAPLGSSFASPPYSFIWDSTTVADGTHTLAARAVDGAGLSTTSASVSVTVNNTSAPSVVGQWSSVINLPAVAVNLILLQNNEVLFYQDGSTPTVWDYVQNTFTNIPESMNLFCSGHALLSDGRIMVVGGYGESSNTIGIANAEIFDPIKLTWTSIPNMQYRRWYPTATTLSDGRIIVTAGWQTTAHTNAGISEIYDPIANKWTSLTNANNPFETYPFLYLLPDGRLLHIGGSEYATDTDVLDLNTATWSVVDSTIVDGGSATMYMPNKFMKAGSASDSQDVGASSNTTFVLDMTQHAPVWQQTPSMVYPRSFLNLTMLPDNTVLATGGETDRNGGNISKAVYAAELWLPQTQTWSTMASMQIPREYHGTALLLPDARVLVSGMGADFGNVPDEKSAQFYSPPYLFKGARPTISQAPTQIQYNSTFFVSTPDSTDIASVVLIRTGAVTHFFDQNERFLPLSFSQISGGLTVTAPVDANLAPPGYYMLFVVNNAGVPSVAPFVQLP